MPSQTDSEETTLISGNLDSVTDPFALFADWFAKAASTEVNDHNAVALATVDDQGMPDVRMVLLKGFDKTGFTFYTNLGSNKARQLAANPKAALCFHWKSLNRQIRIRGTVSPVSDAEADAYFDSRHRMKPHRRLGKPPVAAAGKPVRAGKGGRGLYGALPGRTYSPSRPLVRLPDQPGFHRILATGRFPTARPVRLQGRRFRRMDGDAALSVRPVTLLSDARRLRLS